MTILKAGDLTPTELLQLLGELNPPAAKPVRCWLDAPEGWTLDYWPGPSGTVNWRGAGREPKTESLNGILPRVQTGRVFTPSGELKWRLLPALGVRSCRVVFLGESWASVRLEALPTRTELAGLHSTRAVYPLWGQQTIETPEEWIDLRIPHRLQYPVKAKKPQTGRIIAKLQVEIWKDAKAVPQFIRLCDLNAEWEE